MYQYISFGQLITTVMVVLKQEFAYLEQIKLERFPVRF
jgi:hypothetical protein